MRRAGFELIEPLDTGTLGDRHRAVEIRTGEKVLVTRLHAHWTRDAPSSAPFLRLIDRMRSLRAPCVAATLAGWVDDEGWWVAAEDVGGEPLDSWILEAGPLPAGQILSLAHRIATGLEVLHRYRLLHGALTPGTVLCAGSGRIVLADHALLPQLATDEARHGTLPAGHALRGDPAYMSPRVMADPAWARREDDVYALGMVLLYAATGVRPYGDLDMLATAACVVRRVPPPDLRELPFRVRSLIGRCLRPPFYRPEPARIAHRTSRSRWRLYRRYDATQELSRSPSPREPSEEDPVISRDTGPAAHVAPALPK
ncbi:serine/threonine protein kinase, partial [Actinomadura bangladeshensis]